MNKGLLFNQNTEVVGMGKAAKSRRNNHSRKQLQSEVSCLQDNIRSICRKISDESIQSILASDSTLLDELKVKALIEEYSGSALPLKPTVKNLVFVKDLDRDSIEQIAKSLVPKPLSDTLALAIDGERLCPSPRAIFPKEWASDMQCLESSQEAMNWIVQSFRSLKKELQTRKTFVDFVKILACATVISSRDEFTFF